MVTAQTAEFRLDQESNTCQVQEGQNVTIGGIVTEVRMKTTRKGDQMAFVKLEDRTGDLEVTVFPRTYQQVHALLQPEAKVLVSGRAQLSDNQDAKLLAESVLPFSDVPRELWLQFADMEDYRARGEAALKLTGESSGADTVVIYLRKEKGIKRLPGCEATPALCDALSALLSPENVRISYRKPKNRRNGAV